jgi:hypothetical protein
MSKYYAHMEWGNYHSDCPDLDAVPFFYTDALETLAALPKNVKPLSEFNIFADGHSEPPRPGPIPCILIQEGAVFAVNIHVFGDFCGHGEPPLNHVALIAEAQALIAQTKPHLFKRRNAVSLICPKQLAEEMIWV